MSVINNRVHQFSLEYLKSLRVVLNPLYHHKSVTRGREFFRVVHGPVLQATNPQCNVKMDFTKEMKPAFVEFTYLNGQKRSKWFDMKLGLSVQKWHLDNMLIKSEFGLESEQPENEDFPGREIETW